MFCLLNYFSIKEQKKKEKSKKKIPKYNTTIAFHILNFIVELFFFFFFWYKIFLSYEIHDLSLFIFLRSKEYICPFPP